MLGGHAAPPGGEPAAKRQRLQQEPQPAEDPDCWDAPPPPLESPPAAAAAGTQQSGGGGQVDGHIPSSSSSSSSSSSRHADEAPPGGEPAAKRQRLQQEPQPAKDPDCWDAPPPPLESPPAAAAAGTQQRGGGGQVDGHIPSSSSSSSSSSSKHADEAWRVIAEAVGQQLPSGERQQVGQRLRSMRHQLTRVMPLQEKAEMLDQIGATVNELGCDYKGGVRTQGLSSDQYNLAYADPRKIDTKSYGPEYSTPGAAPAGEPAAPGGHLDLRRRGGLLHLTQSIWLTSELELTFGGGAAAGAVCDEGGGCGRGPNGEPLLLLPVTDVMLHKDCQGSYLARNRWSKTARLIPNCPPGSRAAAIADYSRQLRKLFVESPAAPKLVVLMGQGSDSGNFWQKRVAAGSVPDVGGRVVDISAEVAPLLLAHLRRGEGYEALAAALEADLGLCGGLAAPFAVVWLRPGSLNPLLILSSVHGCSDQWRVDQAPRGVVEVHAFLSLLGGRELPPHSALPKTSPGLTRADKRIIGTQYYGCMGCLLALNLQLTADGAKPLAKGLQCCYACEHAGIDGLPLKQKRHMYSIHLQQRYAEPTVLSELSSSAATQAFVASAQALAAARQRGDEAQAALRSTWMQLLLPEAAGEEQHAAVLERQRAAEARQRAIEQRQQAERLERQEATAKRRREAALASGERAAQQRAAALSAAQAEYAAAEADGTAEALAEDGWDAAPLEMDAAEVAAAHRAAGNAWRLQAAEERRQQRAAAAAERRRAAEQRRQQQAAAAAEQWRVAALASGEWASQQRAAALSAAQAEYAAAEEDGTAEALAEDGWEVAPLEMDAAEVAAAHRAAGNAWRLQAAEEWRQQQAAAAAEQRQQQAAATEELQKQQQAAATEELQKQQQAAAAEQRQAAEAAEQRVAAQWRIVAELWRGSNVS